MPSTYVDELAERAATITEDEWRQSDELRCQLAEQPTAFDDLKTAIAERPALQGHLAWKTAYTPSKWL